MSVSRWFRMVDRQRMKTLFFQTLDRSMSRQSFGTTYCRMDLIQQFRQVRSLWDTYHEILKNLEIIKVQERQSQTDPDKLRLWSIQWGNSISSKRRSLGEPFSRQLRLKSSGMPESSQNGSVSEMQDYDKAMGELINKVDDGTYLIAGQCLRDPKILRSYSYIPNHWKKDQFFARNLEGDAWTQVCLREFATSRSPICGEEPKLLSSRLLSDSRRCEFFKWYGLVRTIADQGTRTRRFGRTDGSTLEDYLNWCSSRTTWTSVHAGLLEPVLPCLLFCRPFLW